MPNVGNNFYMKVDNFFFVRKGVEKKMLEEAITDMERHVLDQRNNSTDYRSALCGYFAKLSAYNDPKFWQLVDLGVKHGGVCSISRILAFAHGDDREKVRHYIFCRSVLSGNIELMEWASFFDDLIWFERDTNVVSYLTELTANGKKEVLDWLIDNSRVVSKHRDVVVRVAAAHQREDIVSQMVRLGFCGGEFFKKKSQF